MLVAHEHVGQRLQLGMGVGRARRVGGRELKRNHLVFGVIARSSASAVSLKLSLARRDDDGRAAAERDHLGIADPVGRGMMTSSPGFSVAMKALKRTCLPPVETIVCSACSRARSRALNFAENRLAQLRDARDRGVLGLAARNGLDGRLLDVVGRVEVRLAGAQADDVHALRFQLPRLLRHGDRGGGLHAVEGSGEEGHGTAPFCVDEAGRKEVQPLAGPAADEGGRTLVAVCVRRKAKGRSAHQSR